MYKTIFMLIPFFLISVMMSAQGLVSQFDDSNGNYLRLGLNGNLISPKTNLYLGVDKIETYRLSLVNPAPIRPTLHLNPVSGNVTIGATDGDFAALTIRSFDEASNPTDLRLEGQGRISSQGSLYVHLDDNNNANEYFSVKGSAFNDLFWIGENGFNYMRGNLSIGNVSKHAAGYRLSVDGKIMSEEVRVELDSNWPDYVFESTYQLLPLDELESEIKELGHLPGLPAAVVVEEEGFELGEMNRLLVEKVEELTLYIIDLNHKLKELQDDIK